ncbi:transglycosylase domain-containing protein [Xanthomonas dyei]|uniref:Glycosyl transferase family 51 domain-containing protein n=1 Tax=Xanthomonas dyei TaxID=743699 RepID=A0A2S7C7N5_9XANT|nr:transglycosylase domain-containing protein [Xanthomonas dyei]PPU57584.1 hypothetical protein XdyCFBP7245_05415 [Xanthomonas dyei]
MKFHSRAPSFIAISTLVLPILVVVAYDVFVFSPRLGDIRAILVSADPFDRSPPPNIRRYIQVLHRGDAAPSALVAMRLRKRFLPGSTGFWSRMGELLWGKLLWLHLSQDEVIALYSTLAYNEQGNGLNALSHHLFAKPLNTLTEQEAATVVAYTWAPSIYRLHPERLVGRRDGLIQRARSRR